MATITLTSIKDSYIVEGSGTNHGSASILLIQSWYTNMRALFGFDLSSIPAGSTINSAVLKLDYQDQFGYPRDHRVSRITGAWEEMTVNWANQPATTPINEIVVPIDIATGYKNHDVTLMIRDAFAIGPTVGFMVADSVEYATDRLHQRYIRSKEYAYNRPLLEVDYTPPAVGYTLTIYAMTGGTTDPAPGSYSYPAGSIARVTAYPASGYRFDRWYLDGVTRTENPIDVLMDQDHTLRPIFETIPPLPKGALEVHAYVT